MKFVQFSVGLARYWPHFLTTPDRSLQSENGMVRHTAQKPLNALKIRRTRKGPYRFDSDSGHQFKHLASHSETLPLRRLRICAGFCGVDELSTSRTAFIGRG